MSELSRFARAAVLVSPGILVSKVVLLMQKYDVEAVVVADPDRSIRGIFTKCDVAERVENAGLDPAMTPVRQVMTVAVKSARPGATVDEAIQLMLSRGFRHLPITDSTHRITGIVSMRHLPMPRLPEQHVRIDAYAHAATG